MSEEAGTTFEQDDSGDHESFFILETPSRLDRRQSASEFIKLTSPDISFMSEESSFVHSENEVSPIAAPTVAAEPVSPKPYLKLLKKKKEKGGRRNRAAASGDTTEEANSKTFTKIVKTNLEAWKAFVEEDDGNNDVTFFVNSECIGLDTAFWDMTAPQLVFRGINSKFRHCLHEVCETLNLSHESSGLATDRIVTVSRELEAKGHDMSKAAYGCQYFDLSVEKQTAKSKVLVMSVAERDNLKELICDDDSTSFEAKADLVACRAVSSSLAIYPEMGADIITLVNTEQGLQAAVAFLSKHDRFGFDLEWHSYRSYLGITCTIQIAAEEAVYVIDALACFDLINHYLGPLFENPNIVKVGLCINQDVAFLLRDFGIVTRGAVDLQIAAGILQREANLGYLAVLSVCGCNDTVVNVLAKHKDTTRNNDWRLRPLTQDMLYYAGADSYYLVSCLGILTHRLKQEFGLVDAIRGSAQMVQASLQGVMSAATEVKTTDFRKNKQYKIMIDSVKKQRATGKGGKKKARQFSGLNEYVLGELYAWRDREAFNSDESQSYIASSKLLFEVALKLPNTIADLLDLIVTSGAGYPERDLNATLQAGYIHNSNLSDLPSPTEAAREEACIPLFQALTTALESYEKPTRGPASSRPTDEVSRGAWGVHLTVFMGTLVLIGVLKLRAGLGRS
jgi:ribonuclease D